MNTDEVLTKIRSTETYEVELPKYNRRDILDYLEDSLGEGFLYLEGVDPTIVDEVVDGTASLASKLSEVEDYVETLPLTYLESVVLETCMERVAIEYLDTLISSRKPVVKR